ncbi:MAG: glycosyltransferase family 39 protein [Nitrospirae bacterium]|nr:glycosyltransferase family 39 protein [Nitrospirota bacterium]
MIDLIGLDRQIFFLINHGLSNVFFDKIMPFVTARGYLLLLPYIFYLLYKGYKERKDGRNFLSTASWILFISFVSFLLTDWVTTEVKNLIGRIRPCNTLASVNLLVGCTGSYSLPSNHASNSFAFALPLFYFMRGYSPSLPRLYPAIVAVLISFSRVYVGVHYPSDVMAGALLGIFVGFTVMGLYEYASLRYKDSPHITLLFSFLFAISIFRIYYILHGPLDLGPDEAHYWEWSRRLDLSYYSKGPMIAYLIYIGTSIFGDTVFGIRIMAVVFSALSSIYLFKLVNEMYDDRQAKGESQKANGNSIALISAFLLQIIPLFAPFGVIFTIDSPYIFFWILSLYLFWKALFEGQRARDKGQWLFLGIVVGLGLLTKYTMAFFYASAFLFLLFSEKRYLLKTFKPYAALFISLLVFSPVIIWNFQHDWVTIKHTAGQAHVAEGIKLSLKTFIEFLISQIGIITPILFVMMCRAIFKLQKSERGLRSEFLFWFFAPVIAFFLLKSIQGKVQPNWAMTGYITGIIAFARYLVGQRPKGKGQTVIAAIAILLALLVTVISHYPSLIKLPVKLDPSSRIRGWKELGIEVGKVHDSISAKGETFIFSDRYQVSSELAFYVKGHPRTYSVNLGRRMNQYDLWPDMNSCAAKVRQNNGGERSINAVFVTIGDISMPAELAGAFERFERKLFQVYDRGRLLREYSIFICYNFKGLKSVKPETY